MTIEERISQLEEELAALKKAQSGSRLSLPVDIIGEDGKTRCRIEEKRSHLMMEMYNSDGHAALVVGIDGTDCGFVTVCTCEGEPAGFMDVESFGARLELKNLQGSTGIAMQGNDCDGDSGWLKVLSHKNDDEICLVPESPEEQ